MEKTKKCLKCGKTQRVANFISFKNGNTSAYCKACVNDRANYTFSPEVYDKILRKRPINWS